MTYTPFKGYTREQYYACSKKPLNNLSHFAKCVNHTAFFAFQKLIIHKLHLLPFHLKLMPFAIAHLCKQKRSRTKGELKPNHEVEVR